MSKAAVFTMKLEQELRDEFIAAAEASHRSASQVVRELMRGFVQQQSDRSAYIAFLQEKVDIARESIALGEGFSSEEVEAEFAERRRRIIERS